MTRWPQGWQTPTASPAPSRRSDAMKSIAFVVPCSSRKTFDQRVPGEKRMAQNAYCGQAFLFCRQHLEGHRWPWFILSGKHGFLHPYSEIQDYNQKIEAPERIQVWDEAFDMLTDGQHAALSGADRVIVLGSALYADVAEWLLGREVERPYAGLPIGKMLQLLKSGAWIKGV